MKLSLSIGTSVKIKPFSSIEPSSRCIKLTALIGLCGKGFDESIVPKDFCIKEEL